MLRSLPVEEKTVYVRKTGLPFFDSARLIGCAYYFFGANTSTLRDYGAFWRLTGIQYHRRRQHEQITFITERLRGRFERIESTTLAVLEGLDELVSTRALGRIPLRGVIDAYFSQPFADDEGPIDTVSRYLEPAFLQGARGSSAWGYANLASQSGTALRLPKVELVVATIGLGFAALASSESDRWLLLPYFEAEGRPTDEGTPFTLTPFFRFQEDVRHEAGGAVPAMFAGLTVITDLQERAQVWDLAYARHGSRGFYESGLFGLRRSLALWRGGHSSLLGQCQELLSTTRNVSRSGANLTGSQQAALLALARSSTQLLLEPTVHRLEETLRIKTRLRADDKLPSWIARQVSTFLGSKAVEEVIQLVDHTSNEARLAEGSTSARELPDELARAVSASLRLRGKKEWVGWYIRLENAHRPGQLLQEIERLVTRSTAKRIAEATGSDATSGSEAWIRSTYAGRGFDEIRGVLSELGHLRGDDFRLFKAAFLLAVHRDLWFEN